MRRRGRPADESSEESSDDGLGDTDQAYEEVLPEQVGSGWPGAWGRGA